jgi:hypothetical protein
MISINNVQPLSPESLFDLLKTELPAATNLGFWAVILLCLKTTILLP